MTSFKTIFKQMFVQKRKYADLVLLLQVFAVVFLLLMNMVDKNSFNYFYPGTNSNWLDNLMGLGLITTPIADVIFVSLLCWQNEKINLSQTWHLVPLSDIKMWLTNMFSSLVECIYIFIIQVVLGIIVAILSNLSHHLPVWNNLFDSKFRVSDIWPIAEMLLFLTGLVLIIFTFVSFANFLTRLITDQLPFHNNIIIKLFVMAAIVVVAVFIAARLNDQITTMYLHHLAKEQAADLFGVLSLEYFGATIILGIINCCLLSKFVEPKISVH